MLAGLLVLASLTLPLPSEQWLKTDVYGFHVISNASAEVTKALVTEMASVGRMPVRANVIIFRDARAYGPVRDLIFQRVFFESKGVYLAGRNEHFILVQADVGLAPLKGEITKHAVPALVPEVTLVRASHVEVLTGLGHLFAKARQETEEVATAFMQAALRTNAAAPLAHLDLGNIEKAVENAGNDAHVLMLSGSALLERLGQTKSAEDLALARNLFERATRLDPRSARAFAGLGSTYVVSPGDPTAGIAALERSLELGPAQEDVAVNLMTLYSRAGRREDMQRIYDTVVSKSTDAEIQRIAGLAMQRLQKKNDDDSLLEKQIAIVEGAMTAANAGRYAEALKTIDEVLPQIRDAAFRANVEKLRADIAKKTNK